MEERVILTKKTFQNLMCLSCPHEDCYEFPHKVARCTNFEGVHGIFKDFTAEDILDLLGPEGTTILAQELIEAANRDMDEALKGLENG